MNDKLKQDEDLDPKTVAREELDGANKIERETLTVERVIIALLVMLAMVQFICHHYPAFALKWLKW